MKTVNQRLRLFFEYKKLDQVEIAKMLNTSKQRINNWLTDTSIPMYSLTEILGHFPDINPTWLLTGDETMLRDDSNAEEPPEPYHINKVCSMCEEKEKMIEVLNQRIADKDDMIDLLRGNNHAAGCG